MPANKKTPAKTPSPPKSPAPDQGKGSSGSEKPAPARRGRQKATWGLVKSGEMAKLRTHDLRDGEWVKLEKRRPFRAVGELLGVTMQTARRYIRDNEPPPERVQAHVRELLDGRIPLTASPRAPRSATSKPTARAGGTGTAGDLTGGSKTGGSKAEGSRAEGSRAEGSRAEGSKGVTQDYLLDLIAQEQDEERRTALVRALQIVLAS